MAVVKKGVLTQGTQVWIQSGTDAAPVLTKMVCITAIEMGDDSVSDIDDTCLEETDTKTSQPGLNTPGEGTITIKTDPTNASHLKLLQLAENREAVKVIVGWSDGASTVVPTLQTSKLTLPTGRTFSVFDAVLRASSPTFEADSLVEHKIAMKRQSKVVTTYKVPA